MILTLEVTGPHAATLGTAHRKVFDKAGGAIGRVTTNDWVLPHRHVSSHHALIRYQDGVFSIEDTESVNGIFINSADSRLAPGERYRLKHGDSIFIDPFEIRASIVTRSQKTIEPQFLDPFHNDPTLQPASSPFISNHESPRSSIPFPGSDPPSGDDLPSGESVIERLAGRGSRRPPRSPVVEDLRGKSPTSDHFPDPVRAAPPPIAPAGGGPLIPPGWDNSDPDGPSQSVQSVPRRPVKTHEPPPSPHGRHPVEPAAIRDRDGARAPIPGPSQRIAPPSSPDLPVASPGLKPARVRPAPVATTFDVGAMLKAAGLDEAAVTPELARSLGLILRLVVRGVMDLLQARREIMDEFRIPGTRIEPHGNNPLKFSPDLDEALQFLLVKRSAGWLGSVEAFEDAFDDLRNHQMAVLQGIRAAFETMLAEFDPDRLEAEFDQVSKGSLALVPAKLRYWDLYRNKFGGMVKDAEASFAELFGEEFGRADQKQLELLKAKSRPNNPRSPKRPAP